MNSLKKEALLKLLVARGTASIYACFYESILENHDILRYPIYLVRVMISIECKKRKMQISGHAPNTKVNHFIQHHHAILGKKKSSLFLVMYPSSSFTSTFT